ncbi:extracellular matrix protein 1 [Cottoperca gobio]|uniref:Extracellular matrix protein 1 n=1 Tax=Cottoperca gobio TaxID=56716 RepID=A0A6J2RD51_COTGO|nr:extracellular matrix protein 1-like [Cottoperca gobio]
MGSSGALVCSTAFVLVLLSSASNGEPIEQREVTFDIDKIIQEIQQPPHFMMQQESDLTELLDPKGTYMLDILSKRDRLGVRPRSFSRPPILDYPVQFPLGQPTSDNLQAICLHGDHRPRYPKSYFPASGFGQQRRRASAVNNGESWLGTCCKGNQEWEAKVMLCCATQAWELSVESFCEEDLSIKDRHYSCCRLRGSDRLNCFQNDAPNPNYNATEELPVPPLLSTDNPYMSTVNFNFDPNTCQRTVMTPHSVRERRKEKKASALQKVDINFPPGRPTADTIESLCRDQKLRPLYKVNCLPGLGYELLSRQAKTINRVEKGFKQCCKKKQDVLNCADQKWREELNKFCVNKNGEQVDFHCCLGDASDDRYNCFQYISPDPHYNMTSDTEELSLHRICDTHKIIKKKFPVGFHLKSFVNQCCPLSDQDKNICFVQKLEEMSAVCTSKKVAPPAVRRCCRMSSEELPQCISKIIMNAITKATTTLRQKKKKRCPLS